LRIQAPTRRDTLKSEPELIPTVLRNAAIPVMDRATAEKLMSIYHRVGDVLNEAEPLVRNISGAQERKTHLRALGTLMQDVWLELMSPIVRQYPELDPDFKPPRS